MIDYYIRLPITAVISVGEQKSFVAEIEGFALSYPDEPRVQAVTLLDGTELFKDWSDPNRTFAFEALWNEAHKPETTVLLQDAYWRQRREDRSGCAGDAYRNRYA